MAETTLRAVSSADDWIKQEPVAIKEPDSLSPHTDVKELNEKLKDAERYFSMRLKQESISTPMFVM